MITPIVLHLKIQKGSEKGPESMAVVLGSLVEIFRNKPEVVSFEIVCKGGFIHFFVVCERQVESIVRGQIFSQYPDLEINEIVDYVSSLSLNTVIATAGLKYSGVYSLKTFKDINSDFLTSLSGLSSSLTKDEIIILQILSTPINKESLSYKLSYSFGWRWRERWRVNLKDGDIWRNSEVEKQGLPLFKTAIRVAVDAGKKSELLATSVSSLLKTMDNPNLNSFKVSNPKRNTTLLTAVQKRIFAGKTFILSNEEIATLYHLSSKGSGITQVATSHAKTAEPPLNLPTPPAVLSFASTNFRGTEKEFGIKREDRRKHLYVIGKTGVGKTKLLELLALSDIRENKGCVIMDPHGDFAEEILRYIPRHRLYDVIYFNPADSNFPMSFNPLEGVGSFEFKQMVVFGFISIFKKLFSFTWNQRLEHVLRYTTLALMDVPGATVLGITKILSDIKYRQWVVSQIQDPLVKKFWTTEFSSWNEQYAGEAITPIINKIGQFVANPIIRNIVGQMKSSIKIDEIINNEKILIANFSIGKLGEENSALLGAMFVTKLWQAAVARSVIPEQDRKDTYLYVDEFQNFATSAFANILSEARKYRLNLTVAHQYMEQLPEEVRSTIFGNVGSIISFRVGGEDAAILEKEYRPVVEPEDLMNLDTRNFFIKMTIDGQTIPCFSGRTIDFLKPDEDMKTDVVRISRERWSRPKKEVEKEILEQGLELEEGNKTTNISLADTTFSEPIV